jgi:hypothetical protein
MSGKRSIRLGSRRLPLPGSAALRIALGILLILCGFLGIILPILGFWMAPLGLLALEAPVVVRVEWLQTSHQLEFSCLQAEQVVLEGTGALEALAFRSLVSLPPERLLRPLELAALGQQTAVQVEERGDLCQRLEQLSAPLQRLLAVTLAAACSSWLGWRK